MQRLKLTQRAKEDLASIWRYTFEQWGEAQADHYLKGIGATFERIQVNPLIARKRTELNPPLRIHSYRHHVILYNTSETEILIVRVLHERMNIEDKLA